MCRVYHLAFFENSYMWISILNSDLRHYWKGEGEGVIACSKATDKTKRVSQRLLSLFTLRLSQFTRFHQTELKTGLMF